MNKTGLFYIQALLIIVVMFFAAHVSALVVPDEKFGEKGLVLTNIGNGGDEAAAIAVQEDGKILVAGSSSNGTALDIAVARYLSNGSLDPEFHFTAGPEIGSTLEDARVRALVINEDGTIVLAGYITENGVKKAVLVRLLADGRVDYNFGSQGISVLADNGKGSDFNDIVVLQDKQIVAAGSIDDHESVTPVIVRFDSNGVVDKTFGADGIVLDDMVHGEARGLVVSSAGDLYVCGYGIDDADRSGLYLARYDITGQPVEAFGDNGRLVIYDQAEEIVAHDLALLPDGSLVIAGEVVDTEGVTSIMIGRFSAVGVADSELSENGMLVHKAGDNSAAYSVAVLEDGTAFAAGYQEDETGKDTILLQFTGGEVSEVKDSEQDEQVLQEMADEEDVEKIAIRSLNVSDDSLSPENLQAVRVSQEADLVTTGATGADEVSRAIIAAADGSIYAAGSSGQDEDTVFMVVRYTEDGRDNGPVEAERAVIYNYYSIQTSPIADVTRVGALTGGRIFYRGIANDDPCVAECQADCSESVSGDGEFEFDPRSTLAECKVACLTSCEIPTVDKRGVVYSIDRGPTYDESLSDGDATTGTTGSGVVTGDSGSSGTDAGDTPANVDSGNNFSSGSVVPATIGNLFVLDNFFNFTEYFVRKGQTEEGSGTGVFTSEIEDANPETTYYVRAYALLSDGSVIYGNEYYFRTDDSCFIATAAFGSVDDFAVQALRQFRDRYLKPYEWGRGLVAFYYRISPPIADGVAASPLLRVLVILLLLPFVTLAMCMLYVPASIQLFLALTVWYRHLIRKRLWEGM